MSPSRWLIRPLARFLRLCWMGRDLFWRSRPPGGGRASRPRRTRLEGLLALEQRETPDDVTGLLAGGMGLGRIAWLVPQPPLGLHQESSVWRQPVDEARAGLAEAQFTPARVPSET